MIIDFRGRPPTPEYLRIFDLADLARFAKKIGASEVSRSFRNGSMDDFFEEMKSARIDYTVALGQNRPEMRVGDTHFPSTNVSNEHVHELQTRFPDKIIGIAGVDVTNTVHDAVSEIDEFVAEKGLRGVFIEPQRSLLHPDDPSIFPIYERCIELDVAVTVMTGPFAGPDISYGKAASIDSVATRYPSLKVVVAHGCWPYVTEILAVALRHENVYVCPDTYHFLPGSEQYVDAANGFMADQLIFATAYPARPLVQTVEDFKHLGLDPAPLAKALGENARKILGI